MNKSTALIAPAVLLALMLVSTAAWTWLPYYNAVNLTVSSWMYNMGTFNAPATYALVHLSNATLSFLAIRGYVGTQPVGSVPYWIINQNGGNVVLLLYNLTNESIRWKSATVFYNRKPSAAGVNATAGSIYSYQCGNYTGLECNGAMSGTYNGQTITMVVSNLTTVPLAFTKFVYDNGIDTNVNFTLNQYVSPSFVFLSNRSLASRTFTNYFVSSDVNLLEMTAASSLYNLITIGYTGTGTVSSAGSPSSNANTIFLGKTDGTGFEEFYSTAYNSMVGEGMGVTQGFGADLYNSVVSNVGVRAFIPLNDFKYWNFSIAGNTPTSYFIMPAFTSATSNSPPIQNTSSAPPTGCTGANYFCYAYKIQVNNINFDYNYSSNATGNALNTKPIWFNFTGANVPFLQLSIPHHSEMGAGCSSIYADAYNNVTKTSEPVLYYLENCSSNGSKPVVLILQNKSTNSFPYNSIGIYYGSGVFGGIGSSNAMVKNLWNFASGNSVKIITGAAYIMNTSAPLSSSAFINGFRVNVAGNPALGYYTNFYSTGRHYYLQSIELGYPAGNAIDWTGLLPTGFLVTENGSLITKRLAVIANSCGANMQNTTNTVVSNTYDCIGIAHWNYSDPYANANFYKLASPYVCGLNGACGISIAPGLTNSTVPPPPPTNATSTIPQTSNGINYTDTTTINITSNAIASVTLGDTGIQIPLPFIIVLQIIIVLLALSAYEVGGHVPSIVMLLVSWIIGVFAVQLLAIAVMASLLMIVEHYILDKERKQGGGAMPPYGMVTR